MCISIHNSLCPLLFQNPGVQEAVVICLNKQTREPADQSLCVSSRRPPQLLQDCKTQACPPRCSEVHQSDALITSLNVVENGLCMNITGDLNWRMQKKWGGNCFLEKKKGGLAEFKKKILIENLIEVWPRSLVVFQNMQYREPICLWSILKSTLAFQGLTHATTYVSMYIPTSDFFHLYTYFVI